jgi:hypothetical protein
MLSQITDLATPNGYKRSITTRLAAKRRSGHGPPGGRLWLGHLEQVPEARPWLDELSQCCSPC